jgi:hypothetical protein
LFDQWSGLRAVAGKSLFVANDTFYNHVCAHIRIFPVRDTPISRPILEAAHGLLQRVSESFRTDRFTIGMVEAEVKRY